MVGLTACPPRVYRAVSDPEGKTLMTGSDRSFRTLFTQVADWAREHAWDARASNDQDEEEPLRAALFSSDQMVAHGRQLAGRHRLAEKHRPDSLLARLASNQRVLETVARQLRQAVADDRPVTPAAEWLLDNMYLIDEEIRTARRPLPHGYSRELPRLADADPAQPAPCRASTTSPSKPSRTRTAA